MPDDPDDRDRRRPRTPPVGVLAQTAPPMETWDDVTPPLGTSDPLHRIGRRVKQTAQTTLSTLDLVESLRSEVRQDIVRVDGKVDRLGSQVSDVRETVGEIGGKLDGVVLALQEDRDQRVREREQHATMRVTAFAAEVEVDKTRKLSEIEIQRDAAIDRIREQRELRRYRRLLALKIFGWVAVSGGTLWSLLASHCR